MRLQFFDLTLVTAQAMAKLPVIPVPSGFRFQPIDPAEVADRLVELALGAPADLVPAIAGPRAYDMAELIRSYLRVAGKRRAIFRVPVPARPQRPSVPARTWLRIGRSVEGPGRTSSPNG